MSCVFWLKKSLELAEKEKFRIKQELDDLWQLIPLNQIDIRRYLSISTNERMKKNSQLSKNLIEIETDIEKLGMMIFFEERKET